MNYYERHLGDYARDTGHLSLLEHGIYSVLLDRYYATERGVPDDQRHRLSRAKTEEEKAAVDAVLAEFFVLRDGVWVSDKVEEELEKARDRIEAARENGKRGGRPRKPKPNPTETQPFQSGSENKTQQKAHQAPPNHLSKKEQEQKHVQRAAARFDEFWRAYPVKKGVKDARVVWERKNLDAIADSLLAHVARMKAEDADWQGGYAPHGLTYLRGERWHDEPKQRARASPKPHEPSKTRNLIEQFEGMKHGLADTRNPDGVPKAALPGPGSDPGD